MDAYAAGKLEKASEAFNESLELRKDHYVPYYYLGLINYDRGDYSMAEYHYHTALDSGGEAPLINYALGVNAYADNRLEDARRYLQKSLDAGDSYADRVQALRKKIDARSGAGGEESSGSSEGSGGGEGADNGSNGTGA
jgi:tetratricopeptide (TPR) repeat protein